MILFLNNVQTAYIKYSIKISIREAKTAPNSRWNYSFQFFYVLTN